MHGLRAAIVCCAISVCCAQALGQADYRVYTDHPRLFLESDRLTRLRRDVKRGTLRWRSLRRAAEAGAAFPEQPLVDALRFQVEGAEEPGREAVAWAAALAADGIRTAAELRLAALVYDWCRELFDPPGRKAVSAALAAAIESVLPQANLDPGLARAAVLASIALAGDWQGSEAALGTLLGTHWRSDIAPALERGELSDDALTLIAVLETCLAVRHNLEVDLLRGSSAALAALVRTRLLSYYPVDIQTPEGLVRRPSRFGADEERAKLQAPLYRIAEMLLVGYESNLREFQFIQGWLRDDNYRLQSPLALPYEFLWVNPYLPGLTPQSAPRVAHDPIRGRLYGRLAWERPTTWVGYVDGRLELLTAEGPAAASFGELAPIFFPDAAVVPVEPPAKLSLQWPVPTGGSPETARIFFIGLEGGETYALKVNNQEARLVQAGTGGIWVLRIDPNASKRSRIDIRKRIRLQLRPTLKPTAPNRPRPTLRP